MSKQLTKEEILDKAYRPKAHWQYVNRENVLQAMQQYADQQTASLKEENERIKGLLEKEVKMHMADSIKESYWQQFKTENNL